MPRNQPEPVLPFVSTSSSSDAQTMMLSNAHALLGIPPINFGAPVIVNTALMHRERALGGEQLRAVVARELAPIQHRTVLAV